MSERKIEIPDEPREPGRPGDDLPAGALSAGEERASPYRNLWVPLVIVPAGIVISVVLVFALFGALAGSERSLDENLDLVVQGGKNERSQALFALVQQVSENHRALAEGREPAWEMSADFLARVASAAGEADEEEHEMRLALGILLTTQGDPAGVDILARTLELGDAADDGGKLRFEALLNLACSNDPRATELVIERLTSEDEGLRKLAASALARVEAAREPLRHALADGSLDVRGTAALSLSRLDPPDPAAASVLRDLLDPAVYAEVNAQDREKYGRARVVSANRVSALEALARLGLEEDRARFEELAADEDLAVRESALRALRSGAPDESDGR